MRSGLVTPVCGKPDGNCSSYSPTSLIKFLRQVERAFIHPALPSGVYAPNNPYFMRGSLSNFQKKAQSFDIRSVSKLLKMFLNPYYRGWKKLSNRERFTRFMNFSCIVFFLVRPFTWWFRNIYNIFLGGLSNFCIERVFSFSETVYMTGHRSPNLLWSLTNSIFNLYEFRLKNTTRPVFLQH